MWKAKVPTKIKSFGWRAVHNSLLVHANFVARGMVIDKIYPRCGEAKETVSHMLFKCEEAKRLWYISPLRLVISIIGKLSIMEWVSSLM